MSTLVFDSLQVVTFRLGGESKKGDYAIPIEHVREIRALETITKIPNAKTYVKGIMNLRDQIVPIMDIKERLGLGLGESHSTKQRILVADTKNTLVGILVDEVDQVLRIQTKDIELPPENMLESNYIKGIVKTDKLLILLDIIKLLDDSSTTINNVMEENKQ
jgi:purine-binding chemotaxis protein CheW